MGDKAVYHARSFYNKMKKKALKMSGGSSPTSFYDKLHKNLLGNKTEIVKGAQKLKEALITKIIGKVLGGAITPGSLKGVKTVKSISDVADKNKSNVGGERSYGKGSVQIIEPPRSFFPTLPSLPKMPSLPSVREGYGDPARDLTKDTKVSTRHRLGGGAGSTGGGYGKPTRDLTKDTRISTRHRSTNRIKEDQEMKESIRAFHRLHQQNLGMRTKPSEGSKRTTPKSLMAKRDRLADQFVKSPEKSAKSEMLRKQIIDADLELSRRFFKWKDNYKKEDQEEMRESMRTKSSADFMDNLKAHVQKGDQGGIANMIASLFDAEKKTRKKAKPRPRSTAKEKIKEDQEETEMRHLRDIVENMDYPSNSTIGYPTKISNKINDFMHCAQQYCQHKSEEWHHDQIHGHHVEEHGKDTPFGDAQYHKAEHHRHMAQHHADQLVKEHGLTHKAIKDTHDKHKGNPSHFTTALAAHLPKK